MVAAVSGSVGGTTFSHNRGGAYTRNRSVPIVSVTPEALNAKQRLATESQQWQTESQLNRDAWHSWALQNPVVNTLGFPRNLTGHQAYVGINSRRASAGDARISTPPIVPAPNGLLTLVQTADIGLGTFELTFTATPLGATAELWILAAVTNSAGIENVNNLLRLIGQSAAAQASPFDHQSLVEARFGTLVVGQTVHVRVSVYDNATGLLSLPLATRTAVITTP